MTTDHKAQDGSHQTVPWPAVTRYSGGGSPEGLLGRVWLKVDDTDRDVEYSPALTTKAAMDVLAERQRQIDVERCHYEYDDEHEDGSLALAASCYASNAATWMRHGKFIPHIKYSDLSPGSNWPWLRKWWKPTNERRDLVKAGALILAEIERLDRAAITKANEATS